jgi:RepB DNA-primase from phage plasmid
MSDTKTKLAFDMIEAKKFLDALCDGDCSKEIFTWQTFDDNEARKAERRKKREADPLTRKWSSPFSDETAAELARLNAAGAGCFVTINKTDGRGREIGNIIAVRKVFVDLDGSPIEPVKAWSIEPHIIIKSSDKRFHAYWRHDGSVGLDYFKDIQLRLATKFSGDNQVNDLPRVMRIPGSWHLKNPDAPFQVRIVEINEWADAYPVECLDIFLGGIELPKFKAAKPKAERKQKEKCRDVYEFLNQEALHAIELWAPTFFPEGQGGSQGEWRVPRDGFQECLSIHCNGIKDWATQWPDHEADAYTAIKLLMAFFIEGADGQPEARD